MVAHPSFDFGAFGPFQIQNPFQSYFQAFEAMSQGMGPAVGPAKAMARCQLEVMGFMNRRAQAYMEIPTRLSRCRTPQDLLTEQVGFWQTAFAEYQDSSRRIMEAWTQVSGGPQGFGDSGSAGRGERDYITFPTGRDANGQAGAPSVRDAKRRVA